MSFLFPFALSLSKGVHCAASDASVALSPSDVVGAEGKGAKNASPQPLIQTKSLSIFVMEKVESKNMKSTAIVTMPHSTGRDHERE